MSRINTNIQSMIAQRVLGANQQGLGQALERLSTGLKINRGKDDPAGLIASENLGSQIRASNAALTNADRADQVVNIAEGGLGEVSNLLTELQGLVTQSASTAGLSDAEKSANQLQVDSILQTIDRIAGSTSFQGIKLLNGNFDFKVSGVAAGVSDYRINAAKFGGTSLAVNAIVTQSAQQGGLYMSLAGALNLSSATAQFKFEVRGSKGSRELTFSSTTTLAAITAAVNTFTDVTGVVASAGATGVYLASQDFGSSEFVKVKVVDAGGTAGSGIYNRNATAFGTIGTVQGTFVSAAAAAGIQDDGQNIGATINGILATAKGKTARINTDFLDVELSFTTTTSQTLGSVGGGTTATITGGGAGFQLAANVDISGKVSMGIGDVAARKLGNSVTGYLNSLASGNSNNMVTGNLTNAQKVIGEALGQVSSLRGRLGAFQKNTIGATIRSLNVAVENSEAAQSVIRDADFASETAKLTRSQILVNASTNVLGVANSSPQSVLQLLG